MTGVSGGGINLFRVYCAGDIGYEDALAALKRRYDRVNPEVLEARLDLAQLACPLALPPLPQSDQPDTGGTSSEGG